MSLVNDEAKPKSRDRSPYSRPPTAFCDKDSEKLTDLGSAELVIDSVEFSASNYTIAWELLLNRYNNSSMLIHNHVKALFTIQKLTKESYHMLRRLIDTILKNLRALKMLGEPTEHWDTLVIFIVTSKLDETTEREWEQYKCTIRKHNETKSSLKVDDLLTFLRDRAEMLETLQASHSKINLDSKKQTTHKAQCNVSTKSQQSRTTYKKPCLMCYNDHALYSCPKFLDANIDTKLHFIATNKLCENCLRSGHTLETFHL
ncbi:uncharacterized protein LOC132903238 [Amyelois transitella]|uniref:uncharacterized protein LOC132903238 n=1 Tax=Amyelois transitella TaxID=680683 RepID=UPI00298F515A|nr:uncharacterized protein LOC132903238 [Amyelois transitella]